MTEVVIVIFLPQPLPAPVPVVSKLPNELFGQTVMVMEFLHTFGPLFNIKDFIAETITFGKVVLRAGMHHVS